MVNNKTTLIVGAGASKEFDLPTGEELKHIIAKQLDVDSTRRSEHAGDHCITSAISRWVQRSNSINWDENPYLQACMHISNAMPQARSIDNFINNHAGNKEIEFCAKLAISKSILDAERKSVLAFDNTNFYNKPNFAKFENTWLNKFFQIVTEDCRIDELPERLSTISLVIFNYDRCIEHFFFYSIKNLYVVDDATASDLVNQIEIYHPYGNVGLLPWQSIDNPGNAVNFGEEPNPHKLIEIAGGIKTFTEGTDPTSSEISSIRKNIYESAIVVFLGFAFHRLNMNLITPVETDGLISTSKKYFATGLGISDSDQHQVSHEIGNLCPDQGCEVNLNIHLKCSKLFDEYRRSLSIS